MFNKKNRLYFIIAIVFFSIGKFLTSPKVEIQEVEKIVYKERTETRTDIDKNVKRRETTLPDGTKIVETDSTTKTVKDKKTDVSQDSEKSVTTKTSMRPEWRMNVIYMPSLQAQDEQYILDIQKRIIGEIYLGANISTKNNLGLSISIGF